MFPSYPTRISKLMNSLRHFTRNPLTRGLFLCLLANLLTACGTIDSAQYRGRTVRRTAVRPIPSNPGGIIRIGAHIENNPYERPYLRRPAGRHPQAPPYGLAVSKVIGAYLREARIPSASANSIGGNFDDVAHIYPGPFRETFGRGGITAETPFDIEVRDASGRTTSRIRITGFGTTGTGDGDPLRASLEDAGVKIVRAIAEASRSAQPVAAEQLTEQGADSLSVAGVARFQSKDYAVALQYFDDAIKADSTHQGAWAYRGAALVKMGRANEGRQSLERAVQINPTSAEAEQARKWLNRLNQT